VEDVVAEDQRHLVVADELLADEEGGGQPVGLGLLGVGERASPLRAVAQKGLEERELLGGGDDEDLVDPGVQQRGDRVVHERLVVDVHQLLRRAAAGRAEPGGPPTGQDDALHRAAPRAGARRVVGSNGDMEVRLWHVGHRRPAPGAISRTRPRAGSGRGRSPWWTWSTCCPAVPWTRATARWWVS